MMKKLCLLFSIAICFSSSPALMAQPDVVINAWFETAFKHDHETKSAMQAWLAAAEEVPLAGSLPDPQLAVAYFLSPVETRVGPQQFSAGISQQLPWFGTLAARKNVASLRAKSTFEDFGEAVLRLRFTIAEWYYTVYAQQKIIEITNQNLALLNNWSNLAQVRFEAGQTAYADVLQIEIEKAELQSLLESQNGRLDYVMKNLGAYLGEPTSVPDLPDSLEAPVELLNATQASDSLLANNHSIQRLRYLEDAAKAAILSAEKAGMPSLSFGLQYTMVGERNGATLSDNGRDIVAFPQVGISLPMNRRKYRAMKKQAEFRSASVAADRQALTDQLERELNQLFFDISDASRVVELTGRQTRLTQDALSILETEYAGGRSTLERLIGIERQLLDFRIRRIRAEAQRATAAEKLNFLTNKQHEINP